MTGENAPLSKELRGRINDPLLRLSSRLRTALALGVVFIMTVKPATAGSLAAMGGAAALGTAAGLPGWIRGRSAIPTVSHSVES